MEKMRGGLGLDAASNGSSSPCQGRVTLTHALSSSKAGKTFANTDTNTIISTFYHSTMFADIGGEIKSSNMNIEV